MHETANLNNVMEAVEVLSLDEQAMLLEVLHNRYIEHRRDALSSDIKKATKEFTNGKCKVASAADIMREILS